ncbi:hypothetical protein AB7Z98_21865 [Providencia manganoxydans]|uniref:hypothetical protein n=1 Tax=Providencia manganoxydans TaxID=2923283 RepID=UPI0034E5677C
MANILAYNELEQNEYHNQQSTINNQQSTINNQQSTINNQQCMLMAQDNLQNFIGRFRFINQSY